MRILLSLISLLFLFANAHALIYYTVKRGDSLSEIAKKFGTTVKAIKRANHLKSSKIYVGQKLKIPVKFKKKDESGYFKKIPIIVKYRVKRGDSVLKIAKKFGVSPRSIIRLNGLKKPYIIRPGQKLKIIVGYKKVLDVGRPLEFIFPIDGRVDPTVREKGYPGVFIIGEPGQKVRASETGIVKFARKENHLLKLYGNMVVIEHPKGYQTVYSNLGEIFVKPKQIVKRGQIIGTVGSSGEWGKSGIYFEISKVYKGKIYPINPLEVLK